MDAIDRAIELLEDTKAACILIKGSEEKAAYESGIKPLMRFLKDDAHAMQGGAIADRVIGKAAAMLMLYGGAEAVYGRIISTPAREILEKNSVRVSFSKEVPYIINRDKTGRCPMESRCMNIDDPKEAYALFKDLVKLD